MNVTSDYLRSQGLSLSFPRRFWAKVNKTASCWLWTGSQQPFGHGQISRRTLGGPILAHRASWLLHFGPIPEGKDVLHSCPGGDNPACVRPEHLWLGDRALNCRDRHSKGRTAVGTAVSSHKLTESSVKWIRLKYAAGWTQDALADACGVTQGDISRIVNNKTWRHV